jgi:predicted small secreted protein
MKRLIVIVATLSLTACGTIGGAVSGAGEDLSRAGQYIKKVGN